MEPLAGRLSFEDIDSMDETSLDERLNAHLKGQPVFVGVSDSKRIDQIKTKKIFLALLEGYQQDGEVLGEFLNRGKSESEEPVSPRNAVGGLLRRYASDAFKERFEYTRDELLLETELMHPVRLEFAKKLEKINEALSYKGLSKLSLREIIAEGSVARDENETRSSKSIWKVEKLLEVFYLTVSSNLTDEEIGKRWGVDGGTISTARRRYFTEHAKGVIRQARGLNPLDRSAK